MKHLLFIFALLLLSCHTMSAQNNANIMKVDSLICSTTKWRNNYLGKEHTPKAKALKLNNKAVMYYAKNSSYFDNQRGYKKASQLLKKAIAIDPQYFLAYSNLIFYAREAKDYETALKYANQYIEVVPDDSVAIYGMKGLVLYEMGQKEEAHKMFVINKDVMMRTYKDYNSVRAAMAKAQCLILAGERDQAISTISAEEVARSCKNDTERRKLAECIAVIKTATPASLVKVLQ